MIISSKSFAEKISDEKIFNMVRNNWCKWIQYKRLPSKESFSETLEKQISFIYSLGESIVEYLYH